MKLQLGKKKENPSKFEVKKWIYMEWKPFSNDEKHSIFLQLEFIWNFVIKYVIYRQKNCTRMQQKPIYVWLIEAR